MKIITWNIEGWKRNYLNLKHFIDEFEPDILLLSEPQSFQCDIPTHYDCFHGNYSFHLNSEDILCPDLPLDRRKAVGGTMAMWRTQLDPYVTVIPSTSTSYLPILLAIPGVATSVHIALYLPTSGREAEFVSALADLEASILQIKEDYACPIYLRGDCNVNQNNRPRAAIFKHFCSKHDLNSIDLNHPTHHHFLGNGSFDAQLDLILCTGPQHPIDTLTSIICKLTNPLVQSHHDVIVTELHLPLVDVALPEPVIQAPRVPNDRVKIIWEDDNIDDYQNIVCSNLSAIRERWEKLTSPSSISILLSSTNNALSLAAKASNRFVKLGIAAAKRPAVHPDVKAAQVSALQASGHLELLLSSQPCADPHLIDKAKASVSSAKSNLKRITRKLDIDACYDRDCQLFTVLQKNPTGLFNSIRRMKSNSSAKIQKLKVNNNIYVGKHVPDGFFDSLSNLKAPFMSSIHSSASFQSTNGLYEHILKICRDGIKIPEISPYHAMELLISLKPDVNDLFSTTARHYLNAGMEGAKHFTFLLNIIIQDVNLSSLEELNSVWAMVLYKGHGSYRTISTCPFLAKALDKYVGSLYESGWAAAQAETQFQGTGSSHELAALLLTECIEFSLHSAKKPLFCIFLDAMPRVHLTKLSDNFASSLPTLLAAQVKASSILTIV